MAQNLVINGVTYNNVESLEMTNDAGERVMYSEGGTEDLDAVLTEQEVLIATLQDTLRSKASGGGGTGEAIEMVATFADGTTKTYVIYEEIEE